MTNDAIGEPEDTELGPESGLDDEGVLDAYDTLEGNPGDDPLDEGVITADRWSAGERFGTTAAEEEAGESLDQLLAEEEPDVDPYAADDEGDDRAFDRGSRSRFGPDPRSGRLVAEDEGAHADGEPDLVARDVGIDAGAASAEEAAVHVLDSDDQDEPDDQDESGDDQA
ncbi:MAG TPA: DUF5709 domain-containing protein [Streptosporangiaceae bacterium]|jgi:nitroreductase|nr:DUF5709 domain-containing protein [Streptosporangiaceae bacterium]